MECGNFSYPSLKEDIDDVSKRLYLKIKSDGYDTISFVTHSMGALVVRALSNHVDLDENFPYIFRTVMIAPPNSGSSVADYFLKIKLIRCLIGPNIENLSTHETSGAKKYPLPKGELGLILGKINRKRFLHLPLYGDNDGIVLVADTKLGIEKDVRIVKASHIGLLFKKATANYVIRFLKNGHFGE